MDMSSEFDSDEGADIINQEMGFTPGSHPRGPDRFVDKMLMGVKGTREKSKAGLKRVMDVDCVGSPPHQRRLRQAWTRFQGFQKVHKIKGVPNGQQIVRHLERLTNEMGGRGLDSRRKYSTLVGDLRVILEVLTEKYDDFCFQKKDRRVIHKMFHQFWRVEQTITKNPFREKQAVRLAAVVYLNEAMVSYTIVNDLGWNALVRNLALLSLLSVTGVRVSELTLNSGYQSQRDYLTYSLLWKDIDFLDEVDVVDGYGGVAIRAVIRIRNGQGKKNDPASDDLLQIFSLKPEWYLVDPIALLMSLVIRTQRQRL